VSPFEILGFTTDDFVPGFVSQVIHGAGGLSAGSATLKVLLVGNKTSAGDMAVETPTQVFSNNDADARAGAGSELARKAYAALLVPGVSVWLVAVADPAGTSATLTITFASNAGSDGTNKYWIGGRPVQLQIDSGMTPTQSGDRLVLQIAANPKLGCTAVNASGTVTLTWKQTGPRGNDIIVRQDVSAGPTTQTSTLGGSGTAISGLGKKFGGGATADDLTNVATATFPGWYQRVSLAARDATQLGVWEASMDSKAGPFEMRPQHTVAAVNGALAAAQSLAQTTLNNARFQLLWQLNGESDPAELAAFVAALRAVTEQADPNASFSGYAMPAPVGTTSGIAPHTRDVDSPQRSTRKAALMTGVTPIRTENGQAVLDRSITTRCLNGTNPDYNTLDTGTAYVPDFVRYAGSLAWAEFRKQNPNVADDAPAEGPERPSGFATPKTTTGLFYQLLKSMEGLPGVPLYAGLARPILIDVDLNRPASRYDRAARRIMSAVPCIPAPKNEQIGVTVLQY
jgi:phage tail sheath gpL-like